MRISQTIWINASSENVFERYADISSWTLWDPEVADVHLPEGLRIGSAGWLRAQTGPKANLRIVEVVQSRSFTVESRLPLCRMTFGHVLESHGAQTAATHWVTFSGPLSFIFRRLIGRQVNASLPQTMRGLKRACEGGL